MINLKYIFFGINPKKIIFLVSLTLIYTLFLLTGDIQEDAFINFRTAFNLADHGELTFNIGEDYNAATSLLYPLLIALIRLASGDHAITFVLIANSISLLFTSFLLTRMLGRIFNFSNEMRDLLWIALSIAPITLLMANRGMEAPYVALLFVVGLCRIQDAPSRLSSLMPVLILPFVRPDAIAFSLILTGFSYTIMPHIGKRYLVSTISAGVMLSLAYYFTIGSFIPNSVLAKGSGIMSQLYGVLDRELWIYFESPFFALVKSKYLVTTYPIFSVFALGLSAVLLYKIWCDRRPFFSIIVAILAGVWLVPAAYGISNAIFPWYFWPSRLLYQGLLIAGVLYLATSYLPPLIARRVIGGFLLVFASFVMLQLAVSYSKGVQESGYRASVGKYIHTLAKDDDTMYLEPSGYIPYFARIRTIDSVGLVSNTVLRYKKNYPKRWEIELLRKEKPVFLVYRNKRWWDSSENQKWFDENYETLRNFEYNPEDFTSIPFLQWILKLGDHTSYHVLKLRE